MDPDNRFEAAQTVDGRYRLLIEAITDYAIYMLDVNGIVTSWNPGAQRFKGYEANEIIGHHFSKFYTEEDRALELPRKTLASARTFGKFESEGWRLRKDGTRFWAHVVIDPIRDPSGELIGYAKITRDLTERKAAEATLLRSEEQFRLLVQSVTDYAIYMLDTEGLITSWNLGAQRIKRYLPEEIIGRHFSQFYTEEDRASGEPQRALATAAATGRYEKEALRVRKDGSTFMAHIIIDPIRDHAGVLIGYAKVTRDITEKHLAQQELEKTKEALYQSQKMEAIGQLTGGIAHDFNNLLMAILVSLALAKKRLPDDPRLQRLLDNAEQAAQRGTILTQRMLAFARRQPVEVKAIDLAALIRDLVGLIQTTIGPNISVGTNVPAQISRVRADKNQLEMALLNLAVNARDAMPEGGPILIWAREETIANGHVSGLPAGGYVCLGVKDQGAGMDAETLTRATEPFFTTKGIGKGTGLGLPMVHGMAEQIGGRLMLKSRKGEGTTAEIWLPIAGGGERTMAEPSGNVAGSPPSLTVLAVDDDPLVLFNTGAMLQDLGHTAIEAASAQQALQILRRDRVDLVITDQAMPQMSGLQLIQAMKGEFPDIPAILATGYLELPGNANAALKKLNKPFNEEDLAGVIAEIFAAIRK